MTELRSFLVVDCLEIGLVLSTSQAIPSLSTTPFLVNDNSALLAFHKLDTLSARLRAAPTQTVVVGSRSELFAARFDVGLRVLEAIVGTQPKGLILQTRSPLVLLATPILCKPKVEVVIALEALSDRTHYGFKLDGPKPSERIETAKALRAAGIEITLQLALADLGDAPDDELSAFVTDAMTSELRLRLISHTKNANPARRIINLVYQELKRQSFDKRLLQVWQEAA